MAEIPVRIKRLDFIPAKDLVPNDQNWRRHPVSQRSALQAMLAEIGYVDAVIARETDDGTLILVDGHLRQEEADPDQLLPTLILDVDEDEAKKVLATLDPLAAMAQIDTDLFLDLATDLDLKGADAQRLVDSMAAGNLVPLGFIDDLPTGEPRRRTSPVIGQQRSLEKLEGALTEFKAQMLAKFRDQRNKYGDRAVTKVGRTLLNESGVEKGLWKHLLKEIKEFKAAPGDTSEAVDVANLAFLLWWRLQPTEEA